MDVNFNNLRVQAMIAYDKLCIKLNETIDNEGYVTIKASDIQKEMDELKSCVGAIACVFENGNENFKMVRDDATMTWFNSDSEDN